MKTQLKWIVACTALCMATEITLGQAGYGAIPSTSDSKSAATSREARESVQFFHSRDLVGADVKDMQDQKLGNIHDILVNAKTGETLAAIGLGHGEYALVPAQVLSVTPGTGVLSRKADITLNTTKEALQAGPLISNDDWQQLDTPSFTQSIYAHYKVHAPSAIGGVGAGSLGGVSSGTVMEKDHINRPATGQP